MGTICKIALRTVGRYGKASLAMLCVGFLFLITTSNSYMILHRELSEPYTLSGEVTGKTDMERYSQVDSVDAVTPVISFGTKLTIEKASLSGMVTAVTSDYLELPISTGGIFPNESNMPFLVLNKYAAGHFQTEDKKDVKVSVNEGVTMTIGEEKRSAIVCGIFDDKLEKPVIYMSYSLAARVLPKEDRVELLIQLEETGALEKAAKELKKLGLSLTYDETMPQRWKLTKQQTIQSFASALVLLICSAVQMASVHRQEQTQRVPEIQLLLLNGITRKQLRWMRPMRTLFAGLSCLLIALGTSVAMGSISILGLLAGVVSWLIHFGAVTFLLNSHAVTNLA